MAEAQPNPLRLGGYNDEFVEEIEEDWLCPICTLPLKEAVQTRRCGHRLCKACIDSHFARQGTDGQQSTCPVCRTNLDREQDVFEDLAADRKILSFIIKCPSRGCQWRGELREKNGHLASCPREIVSCINENCDVKLERKELQDHVTRKCLWRILQCKFCAVSYPALQTRAHQKTCPKVPVSCPRKCGMMIWREKVADHKMNQCALVKISCPYFKLGCREKFQRKEKMSHLQSYMQMHLDLACIKLADTEEELLTTKEQCMKLEHRVDALENRGWPHFNVYTWKIGGFEQILRRAKTGDNVSIYSDPFYPEEFGHKFRMRLFPNGDGEGEKTHVSLFLTNIKGEYDAISQWPFPKKVTLVLIDQQENLDDRKTVARRLGGTEEAWKSRPVKREGFDWGFCKFLSHDELYKRGYIVDDTIFIQAKFE